MNVFNPFQIPGMPQKSPEQLQSEYNAMMQQYQGLLGQSMPPNAPAPAVGERGEFAKVASFDEVSEAPTRLDGTATLFFDFKNRVFWSKKFVNGGHTIQAFRFEPVNSAPDAVEPAEDKDYTKLLEDIPEDKTEERLSSIEAAVERLTEALIGKKTKKPTKEEPGEVVKDEI